MSNELDAKTACLQLRSKQMYYKDHDEEEAEHRREVERLKNMVGNWRLQSAQGATVPESAPAAVGPRAGGDA